MKSSKKSLKSVLKRVFFASVNALSASNIVKMKLHRPIFFVGCPRGGTSIAVDLFSRHPDVANWSEAGRVWDPENYDNVMADHYWGKDSKSDKEINRLNFTFELYRKLKGKQRFVNKHPRNSMRIEFLQKAFPDAIFIHVIRDGRAVVSSIIQHIEREPERKNIPMGGFCKPRSWKEHQVKPIVEQASYIWSDITRYIRQEFDGKSNYFEVNYEQMCTSTRTVFEQLYQNVGLRSNDEIMQALPETLSFDNEKYKSKLSQENIDVMQKLLAATLFENGYS